MRQNLKLKTKRNVFSSFLMMVFLLIVGCSTTQCQNPTATNTNTQPNTNMKWNKLTPAEQRVILNKGTDMPFTGEYTDNFEKGTYICRQCNAPLYKSDDKFHSGCGWPSFDQEIAGAVKKIPDADGMRTEIVCNTCGGHLGHVFYGEGLTDKNTRHCVNTTSMIFVPSKEETSQKTTGAKSDKAVFAGGCFWGVEYYFQHAKGVISTQVGYTGGTKENPTYKEVCSHTTGHVEALEVTFDPSKTNFEELAKLFFEIHDPTQANGQGNDIGNQYLSVIFYQDEEQKKTAEKLIGILQLKGYKIATQLKKAAKFWPAEDYHQQYYEKEGGTPYCHKRVARF